MIIAASIILFYLFIRIIVVVYNFTIQPYLIRLVPENNPLVSVLVPARNEEKNIGILLESLINQTYTHIEILVYDDMSDDGTAQRVKHYTKTDKRIRLIQGTSLPDGWMGKNNACHQLAMASKGDFLMFMDADVIPAPYLVSAATGYMQKQNAGLLSIFPHQITKSAGETLTVPLMYDILLTLLPLAFVKRSRRYTFSGANGQFMLFRRTLYMEHKPHWWKKDEAVEDIAIMQLFKKFNIPCLTLLGGDDIACRMYSSGREAIKGFAKNIIRFFGNSVVFALFHVVLTSFGFFIMLFVPDFRFLSGYILGVLIYKAVLSRLEKESILKAWLLIIPRQLMLVTVFLRAIFYRVNQSYNWKGRTIKI